MEAKLAEEAQKVAQQSNKLYEKLISDLSKDVGSQEIQAIYFPPPSLDHFCFVYDYIINAFYYRTNYFIHFFDYILYFFDCNSFICAVY